MKRQEPFNVIANPNSWERSPRAESIVLALGGFSTTAAATAALGVVGFNLAVLGVSVGLSLVTSWAVAALTPLPPTPKQSILVNSREAAAAQDIVYGETRKGGTITYLETTRDGSVLYQVIALAAHEIESVEAIYLNDEEVTLSEDGYASASKEIPPFLEDRYPEGVYSNGIREGAGWVTNPNWSDDRESRHEVRIFYHLGNQTSYDDTFANSSVESLETVFFNTGKPDEDSQNFGGEGQPTKQSFVGNGIAYLFVRFSYSSEVFQNGIPTVTAKIRGKKVYDPRTETTGYSNNAALCVRDFIRSEYGLNDPEIDDVVFSAAANTCDENVPLDAGGTEKRYTINGVVRADQFYGDVLQEMVTACAGTLYWGGGKWRLRVGEYNAPSKNLTLDDLRSEISLQTRVNLRDQFNRVQGVFTDANQRYIAADYPPVVSEGIGSFTEQDGGVPQSLNLDLPFTTSSSAAQRLAKMTLFRGREQMTFTADFGLNAFDVDVGEIISLTIDRYGWDEKEFEVVGWKFGSNQEAGDLRITLTLRETSEAAFDWNAEEFEIIGNDTNLSGIVEPVTNLTATANGSTNAAGIFINSILVDWDHPSTTGYYRVEWTKNTAIDYDALGGIIEEADAVTDREKFIYKAFIELLYRQPAQDGFDYYNTGGGSSLTEEQLRAELLASPERNSLNYTGTLVYNPATEYVIIPVVDNTIYHIRVRAVNSFAQPSEWRSVTFDTTADTTSPNEPTNVIATGYFQSAVISWTPPTQNTDGSNLEDLKQYNIYRSLADNFASATVVGSSQTPSFRDVGLDDNTVYYYWVTAEDFSGNEGPPSLSNDATTNFISAAQMVSDIREEIGAARIDVVSSLPSGAGYSAGDFVFLTTDKKLYEWNGSSWLAVIGDIAPGSITTTQIDDLAITTPKLASNSVDTAQLRTNAVTAGKIEAGAVSADKIAVTDLAAITANLGEVTAGSINTLSSGIGVQINVAGKPNSTYIYNNQLGVYALYSEHTRAGSGCALFKSDGGWTLQLDNTRSGSNAFGPHMTLNAGMSSGLGGRAWIGVSNAGGGYGVDVRSGGYYDTSGGGYNPFTGRHDGMISKLATYELGDIVVDGPIVVRDLTDNFTEFEVSSSANQKGAVGVLARVHPHWHTPAAFVDQAATEAAQAAHVSTPEEPAGPIITHTNVSDYEDDYDLVNVNSVGEGSINVCGEGGNISKGDLIVTSSTPGKGMKQADDILRSYTVAKAREDVTFSTPNEVKMVACIYLCG